ncbi:DUF4430 domain-containing protein [Streptococcus hongkongensis]|nr:Additional lipoprotein component of cobalamin ECF transporter [Streptococcus uberis]
MKRTVKTLLLFTFSLFLVACSQQSNSKKESSDSHYLTLIVKEDTDTISEKVSFKKGDTIMDVLKANYKVKEQSGFITSIDGFEQDTKNKTYWFFKINKKMAPKAADKIKAHEGDRVEFYQEKIK